VPITVIVLILVLFAIVAALEWRTRRALRLGNDTRRPDDAGHGGFDGDGGAH
jgi:hypothetical protein